jgi:phosphoribosylanthranilate isomerase
MFPYLPRIKVCCIATEDEAGLAIGLGASALGFVSRMPSGPGPIPETRIRDIVATVPPGVASFLLTCETTADAIIAQQRNCRTNTLQLVDEVEPGTYGALRRALPGISIVQVIHVRDGTALSAAIAAARGVDAILLDSGNPAAAVKELGGTGRAHDWTISRKIRDAVRVPVYLAGGLTPSNVAKAINQVLPFGVDACSGLRTDGRLDSAKVGAFVAAVRSSSEPTPA